MYRLVFRRLCKQAGPENASSEQAKRSQRMWDMLVPERNIGVTHPLFFVLGAAAFGLHWYNKTRDEELEAELRRRRLEREANKSTTHRGE